MTASGPVSALPTKVAFAMPERGHSGDAVVQRSSATVARERTLRVMVSRPSPSLPALPGPRGIRDPLAPGARIELATFQASDLHCEEVMACGDAGAAVVDDSGGRIVAQKRLELPLELRGGLERSVGREVVHVEAVFRPGNSARDRVDRLLLAAVARG